MKYKDIKKYVSMSSYLRRTYVNYIIIIKYLTRSVIKR